MQIKLFPFVRRAAAFALAFLLVLACERVPDVRDGARDGGRQEPGSIALLGWVQGPGNAWLPAPRHQGFPGYSLSPARFQERFTPWDDARAPLFLLWNFPVGQHGPGQRTVALPALPLGGQEPGPGHPALFGPTADLILRTGPSQPAAPGSLDDYRQFLERLPLLQALCHNSAPFYRQDVPLWLLLGPGSLSPTLLESHAGVLPPHARAAAASKAAAPAAPAAPRTLSAQQHQAGTASPDDARMGNARLLALLRGLLETHPRIQAAEAQLEAARARHKAARSGFFPTVDAKLEGGGETTNVNGSSVDLARRTASLTGRQLVYDFGGVQGGADKAALMVDIMGLRLEQTRQDVLLLGCTAYLNLLKAQEHLKSATTSEASIARLSGIQDALTRHGMGYSYEELQMRAQLLGARAKVTACQRTLVSAMNSFQAVFGFAPTPADMDGLTHPVLGPKALPPGPDEAVSAAQQRNPRLADLRRQRQAIQAEVTGIEAGHLPRFDAVADLLRRTDDQGVRGTRNEARGGLALNWSLYEGGRTTEQTKALKAQITQVRRNELDTGRALEEQARNAWQGRLSARQLEELAQRQAVHLHNVLRGMETRRMTGEDVRLLGLIIAERDFLDARDQLSNARCDGHMAAFQLLHAMGGLAAEVFGEE